jgi:hypothetical protein
MPKNDSFDSATYNNANSKLANFCIYICQKNSTLEAVKLQVSLIEKEWVDPLEAS